MKKAKGLWVLTLGAALMLAACDSEEIPSIPAGGPSDSSEIDVGSSSEEINVSSSDESSESVEAGSSSDSSESIEAGDSSESSESVDASESESSSSESEEPPAPVAHAITIDPNLVGITITANPTEAIAGTLINLTYVVDADYILNEITVNGEAIAHADGAASFTMPDEAVVVSADLDAIPYYAITIDPELDGITIEADATSAKAGTLINLTYEYDPEHYTLNSITVNGDPIEYANGAASFEMPAEAVTISADIDPIPYHAVIVDADAHAHVLVSAESIKDGEDLTVTITFDDGWHAGLITINGEGATPNAEGVIVVENVIADVTIVVVSHLPSMEEGEGGVVEDWNSVSSEEGTPNE